MLANAAAAVRRVTARLAGPGADGGEQRRSGGIAAHWGGRRAPAGSPRRRPRRRGGPVAVGEATARQWVRWAARARRRSASRRSESRTGRRTHVVLGCRSALGRVMAWLSARGSKCRGTGSLPAEAPRRPAGGHGAGTRAAARAAPPPPAARGLRGPGALGSSAPRPPSLSLRRRQLSESYRRHRVRLDSEALVIRLGVRLRRDRYRGYCHTESHASRSESGVRVRAARRAVTVGSKV